MNRKPIVGLCLTLAIVIFAANLVADDKDVLINVTNSGFENGANGSVPSDWTVTSSRKISGNTITFSDSVSHSGKGSLLVENIKGDAITIMSQPVKLKVGHLYRLSGWVKTEGVESDSTTIYPTALPACLSMVSYPFTNNSPTVGATKDWTQVTSLFIATKGEDHLRVHLGYNGNASGKAWFDDLKLEEVSDITEYIPMETVTWFKEAYRYDDKGWIYVHIEGAPYERGYQYGYLLSDEISQYMMKLAISENRDNPGSGWYTLRFQADAILLRKYDEEYLEEMKGIADGAKKAGAKFMGRAVDLVDIVTLNSSIDLGQMGGALRTTPNHLTGRNFLRTEEEMLLPQKYNKCSAFVATGEATTDGRIVFGQMFMWGGYTGVHWDVICDIQPTKGHRLVYHTFPGGIHSGADFYINDAGIMIGETTVSQTPYEWNSTPQSNRIRKAAQYANSMEDVQKILFEKNNGMYTNDWILGDTKTDEGGVFLLGTKKTRMWRTGHGEHKADTPGNLKDYIWANNNNRSLEVRKEYIPNADNAPYDLIFRPANRDIAFQEFFAKFGKGKIDSIAAVNAFASSPINRPHACDGKITTSEMAEQLVFLAHYGKTTQRSKFVGDRFIRDLPNAEPHLALGYSVASPIFITNKLKEARNKAAAKAGHPGMPSGTDYAAVKEMYQFNKQHIWQNTVYPASDAENWFISATSSYWRIINGMSGKATADFDDLSRTMMEYNYRYNYLVATEGDLVPVKTSRVYDRYNHYEIPRIKGVFALHQLRLKVGGEKFAEIMNRIHDSFANKNVTNADIVKIIDEVAGAKVSDSVLQWLEREGLPALTVKAEAAKAGEEYELTFTVEQKGEPYAFTTVAKVFTKAGVSFHPVTVNAEPQSKVVLKVKEKPLHAQFNASNDVPVVMESRFTMANVMDRFHDTIIAYGTSRQVEANQELAKRWSFNLAESSAEILIPVKKDSEICDNCLKNKDVIVMGSPEDNSLMARLAEEGKLPVKFGKNLFKYQGKTFNRPDDGMVLVLPSPYNKDKILYLFIANSELQLHDMTRSYSRGMAVWNLFRGERLVESGYDSAPELFFNFAR